MHRDLKLANILLHFPNVDLLKLNKKERIEYIRTVNLKEANFTIKISDFGFAKKISSKR
jgi:serine/threonine protein kinase